MLKYGWILSVVCLSACPEFLFSAEPGLLATVKDANKSVNFVAPTPNFRLDASESLHPQIGPQFEATWEGALTISEPDTYSFAGDARITVSGKEVKSGQPIDLSAGEHPLKIEYVRKPGNARLQLQWQGKTFQQEPIPPRAFVHTKKHESVETSALISEGRRLVNELNCAACHQKSSPMIEKRHPIDLSTVGSRVNKSWLLSWLKNPRHFRKTAAMPVMLTDEEDIRDVAEYLSRLKDPKLSVGEPPVEQGRIKQGESLFNTIGCIACHDKDGVDISRMHEKTHVYALKSFLLNPLAIRPDGRMPQMFNIGYTNSGQAEQEAENVARYVLRNRQARTGSAPTPQAALPDPDAEEAGLDGLDKPNPGRGEKLLSEKGCLTCHTLAPKPIVRAHALGITPEKIGLKLGQWNILGPFDLKGGFKTPHAPEEKLDLNADYVGGGQKKIRWQPVNHQDGRTHTLMKRRRNTVTYLYRTIDADDDGQVTLQVGSDDQIAIWLNGEQHLFLDVVRAVPTVLDRAVVPLKKGRNHLLMKVGNFGGGYEYVFKLDPEVYKLPEIAASNFKAAGMSDLDPQKGCLSQQPPKAAANYFLTPPERKAVQAFLADLEASPDVSPAPTFAFYETVNKLNCTACHELDGREPGHTLAHPPPPLTGVGNKLRPNWIRDILVGKKRTRPWLGVRMPHFGPDIQSMTGQFAAVSGTADEIPSSIGVDKKELKSLVAQIGTGKEGLSCIACHAFKGGSHPTGERGREFTELGGSVREDWFRRWMRNPARIRPGTPMPMFFAGMDRDLAEEKITDLWRVVSLGNRIPTPPGAARSADSYTIEVSSEPVVLRAYMQGSAARSIAVGLPGYVNYAFDTENCRLQYVWTGEFIDVKSAWSGRGGGAIRVLGDKFYTPPSGALITHADSQESPIVKFRGYRLIDGAPEFRYMLDAVEVLHHIREISDATGIVQTYQIANVKGPVQISVGNNKNVEISASSGELSDGKLTLPGGPSVKVQITVKAGNN